MTLEIGLVLAVLAVAIILLATEAARVDIIAVGILLALAWLGLVTAGEAFSGLSSAAVVSMAAVMVLGRGVDRSGLTRGLTRPVLAWAGQSERRLLGAIMAVVGGLSAFMQNIGAAALFLPAVTRIARRGGFGASGLLMPMGFAALLGGTVSMIGSGPLILLGDLLRQSGHEPFGLFAVTPYGLALLLSGVAFFVLLGRRVLPSCDAEELTDRAQDELVESWRLQTTVHELVVKPDSRLVGCSRDQLDLKNTFDLHLVALSQAGEVLLAPWRHTQFAAGQTLAVLGAADRVQSFVEEFGLQSCADARVFHELQSSDHAGFAEVLVSPRASLIGKSIREFGLRRSFGVEPVLLLSGGVATNEDFSDQALQAGDTLLVFGTWQQIEAMGRGADFAVVTDIAVEDLEQSKRWPAALCFLAAIALALLGFPLALALSSGALAMVLLRVLSMDAAYRAIDWRTILLIGGLIPLGVAMEKSGAAAYLADQMLGVVGGAGPLVVMFGIGILATVFSLFMSNVAATVVLVPLVVGLGKPLNLDPRMLALLVAVCASNSFVLPTHQVNALLMTAGGYRNADYLRAGGLMTLLFLVVVVVTMYLMPPMG